MIREEEKPAPDVYASLFRLYGRLESGSQSHLRAFGKQLARRGVEYSPVLMDRTDFEAVIDGFVGRRRRGGRANS